jgi:hypothetical protein
MELAFGKVVTVQYVNLCTGPNCLSLLIGSSVALSTLE